MPALVVCYLGCAFFPYAVLGAASFLFLGWSWILIGLGLAILRVTSLIDDSKAWWQLSRRAAGLNAGVSVCMMPFYALNPVSNASVRDVAVFIVLSAVSPLASAGMARLMQCQFEERWINASYCLLVTLILMSIAPYVLLAVHCTSGDCL